MCNECKAIFLKTFMIKLISMNRNYFFAGILVPDKKYILVINK